MHTPHSTKDRKRAYIGFTRVSTPRQAEEGNSEQEQADRIREFVGQLGGELLGTFGEQWTGMGRKATTNADLRAALKVAQEANATVVVTNIDRLGRSEAVADLLKSFRVKVLPINIGYVISDAEVRRLLGDARAVGESIQRKSKAAGSGAKGKPSRNQTNLPDAQRRGGIETLDRMHQRTERLAEILRKHDPELRLTRQEVADLWNGLGIAPLRAKTWNKENVRRPLKRVRELFKEESYEDDYSDL